MFRTKNHRAGRKKPVEIFLSQLESRSFYLWVDYTDHWAVRPGSVGETYRQLLTLSDGVTVPTTDFKQTLSLFVENVNVVEDGLDVQYPAPPIAKSKSVRKVLWFGSGSNAGSLLRVLAGPLNQKHFELNVVGDSYTKGVLAKSRFQTVPLCTVRFFDWSVKKLRNVSDECELVIIPADKAFASPNRIITAIMLGRWAIADPIASYQPYHHCFNEFKADQIDDAFSDGGQFSELLGKAQLDICNELAPEVLEAKWRQLIELATR